MIHVVLFQPEIPQNTGNIARTCAITGAKLHLIRPLGFSVDERSVRRAGLDYWDKVEVEAHDNLEQFCEKYPVDIYLVTTHGEMIYTEVDYEADCAVLFGSESRGVPDEMHQCFAGRRIKIPMRNRAGNRSLNLSNSAAILIYEIWRQRSFQ